MSDFLIRHAIRNVWCTPDQDYQHIFQPARLSAPRGVERQLMVEWDSVNLPNNTDTFSVYQIGQLSPRLLNLLPTEQRWYSIRSACNLNNLIVDLYLGNGRQFPRYDSYIMKTRTRNLLIAIKHQPRIGDLAKNPLYVRFYSNAFFGSERSHPTEDCILTEGMYATNTDSVLLFQRRIRDLRKLKGHVNVFHNGWLVDDTPPNLVNEKDVLELVYDSSIKEVVRYKVQDLDTFNSTIDSLRKYLVSRRKGSTATIDYLDDIDFWLVKEDPRHFKGIYFHKNRPEAVRMVTHKDYSVPVAHVVGFSNTVEDWHDPTELTLLLTVRESGYYRPLVDEHSRIKELYRLTDEQIYRAMLGSNSTVSVWRAPALEASDYTRIMRSDYGTIDRELVEGAYGYNAISKLIADTPMRPVDVGGFQGVRLPVGLRHNATMYEYDENGHLIGFYPHTYGKLYPIRNAECKLVEGIVGVGSETLSTVYGQRRVPIDDGHNYRMYVCPVIEDTPTWEWRDVTGDDNFYRVDNGEVLWLTDPSSTYTAVKNDEDFLAYEYDLAPVGGLYRFSITAREQRGESFDVLPLGIPVGRLEIWLNGKALIENLDYYVRWPEVILVNKEYLATTPTQKIVVRGTGFCQSDMSREKPDEFGFVKHGLLSRNRRFDVRDDKVMRFVVGGKTYHRDNLKFSENDSGLRMEHVPNGTPYLIEDVVVPLRGIAVEDTYTLRDRSLAVDKEISDYLTLYYPEPVITDPNIIEERYQIFSPFVSKLHHDLQEGYLAPDGYRGRFSDAQLKEWLRPYEQYLDFDPIKQEVDDRYVSVHPTESWYESELDIYQYTLLHRAIQVYLDDKVDLSRFVAVKEGWV